MSTPIQHDIVFIGTCIVPDDTEKSILVYTNRILHVSSVTGSILYFGPNDGTYSCYDPNKTEVIRLNPIYEFLCPGFVDTHIHAPQYSYTGTGTDRPLMDWLETYTFPAEMALKDDHMRARNVYEKVVDATLRNGTTTAMYYGTLHVGPTKILCDVIAAKGQRGLVGKVCMDRNASHGYLQSLEENLSETRDLIEYIKNSPAGKLGLLYPVVTPRFIPTCSPALLDGLGHLVKEYSKADHKIHVQTHASESYDEIEFTQILNKQDHGEDNDRSDAEILDASSLLTNRTVLAHCVLINEEDASLLRTRGTSISHCPLSNFFFAGRPLRSRHLLELQNKIGLGTDIAGGYSPSMLNACRLTVINSRALGQAKAYNAQCAPVTDEELSYKHAFYLATRGGAHALDLHDDIGTFTKGKKFDAIILSADPINIDIFDTDTIEDVFQKICCLGDDRNVRRVFVQGKCVINKEKK